MYRSEVASIAEILRARDVRTVIYFHCDHFEPWRNIHGSVSDANAEHILRFLDTTAAIEFARRLTLFYRPYVKATLKSRSDAVFAEETPLGFIRPSEKAIAIARRGMGSIATHSAHDMQLHLHHEYVTMNDKYCRLSKWGSEAFWETNTPEMDRRRFLLLLDLSLETVERETSTALRDWFFVHGNWALNGSDRNVCRIDDEILLLQSRGCRGDFSFPAVPPHDSANPSFAEPSLIRAFAAPKCYNRPEAQRGSAWGADRAATDSVRFFIWAAQPDAYAYVCLDYSTVYTQELCREPAAWAHRIARNALVRDGTMYFNTFAHSMHLRNVVDDVPVFPHDYGPIRSMFGAFLDGAAEAGAAIEFGTARDVHARITGREHLPNYET